MNHHRDTPYEHTHEPTRQRGDHQSTPRLVRARDDPQSGCDGDRHRRQASAPQRSLRTPDARSLPPRPSMSGRPGVHPEGCRSGPDGQLGQQPIAAAATQLKVVTVHIGREPFPLHQAATIVNPEAIPGVRNGSPGHNPSAWTNRWQA
jgi:hypothetical protein